MVSGSETPLATISIALNKNGTSIEFNKYPDFSSLTGNGIMRIAFANSITSSKCSWLVSFCFIISAILFFHIELAKCIAKYLSGLSVYFASLDGNKVDEFVTTTVFSERSGAISL